MVMIGGSIGLLFVVVIVSVLIIFCWVGMLGMFMVIGVLVIVVIGVVVWVVFNLLCLFEYVKVFFCEVLCNFELLCLNFGVFVLYVM